jgi:hypothetical protein
MLPVLLSLVAGIGQKILGSVANKAVDVVDQLVDDGDLATKLKAELTSSILQVDVSKYVAQLEAQKSVLVAEIQGDSWLQKNWRPIMMMIFATIVANNYIIFPYLTAFGVEGGTQLAVPEQMWSLLKLGLSGYIVGRSCEKIAAGSGIKGAVDKMLKGSN